MIPELTDVRASSSCAAFPLWNRQCPGQGRQGTAQPGLDSSLPRSKHTVLGGKLPETSPHSPVPKSRCAKSWNHNLSSWKWISQAKLWKSPQISQYLHLQKNCEQRLNFFSATSFQDFFHRIWPACMKYFVTVVIYHTVVPNPVSVGRIEKAQSPSRQCDLMPFLAPSTKGRSYFALWIPKLVNTVMGGNQSGSVNL